MIFIDPKLWQVKPTMNIYGAEWDGSSNPAWTRTDAAAGFPDPNPAVNNGSGSSPFDDIMPWAGMEIYEENSYMVLVAIPKYYYKWTRTGAAMKLQISPDPQEGFLVSPAHADRGDGAGERDIVYVGRYHADQLFNQSMPNDLPWTGMTRSKARKYMHANGADYWLYDFAMYWTIMMLYLVEYANWNSQAMIGYGCSPSGAIFKTGLTNSMRYHTGTTAANRTTYGCCQYRHIEGLWDNVYDWVDGIYFSGASIYCIKNPANFSDTTGGTLVGTRQILRGYISSWTNPSATGFEYALYPSQANGTENTYVCDNYFTYSLSDDVTLYVGAPYNPKAQTFGAFYFDSSYTAAQSSVLIGCRLMKLP